MHNDNAPKKTEYITFRATKDMKDMLAAIAAPKKWSISLLVEDIVQQWLQENGHAGEAEKE